MRLHFTTIPVFADGSAEEELNRFLAAHRVLSVDRQLVEAGSGSAWAVCVQYSEAEGTPAAKKAVRVDYREVLNEAEFAVYAQLRTLRKTLAEREGVPPYALFTNEHLAAMVQRQVQHATELGAIEGVGKARIEKYGAAFLEVLHTALAHRSGLAVNGGPA